MSFNFFKLFFFTFLVVSAVFCVNAQTDASSRNSKSPENDDNMPKSIKETIAKSRIDREKKDYEELITRSEESAKLSKELEQSFTKNNQLTSDDQKKLERLEKNLKKIRNELGGEGDDDQAAPLSIRNAFEKLQDYALTLADELKKTTRYTISASAIETSNALLKIVRFIRLGKN